MCIRDRYQALYTQNSDLAGWIQIDETNINYPVMQSKQDPDFYLKHNFEKADSPHGCPYVQANCDLQTPSDNILVYGHNMKDGTMFSDLLQYKRESFWEQHRIIRFDTLTAQEMCIRDRCCPMDCGKSKPCARLPPKAPPC